MIKMADQDYVKTLCVEPTFEVYVAWSPTSNKPFENVYTYTWQLTVQTKTFQRLYMWALRRTIRSLLQCLQIQLERHLKDGGAFLH